MNLKQQREAALKAARDIAERAKEATRDLTADEIAEVDQHLAKADDLAVQIKQAEKSADLIARIGAIAPGKEDADEEPVAAAKSIGEHFVKSGMADRIKSAHQTGERFTIGAPEFKAATDPTLTSNTGGLAPQYGGVLETKYRQLTIADLLASGSLSQPSLTYWQQGTLTGDVASTAEGALKPSLNFAFGQVTETLAKLAGVTKVSDEMTEDADFMVSIIRSQLLQRLAVVEEDQVLNGNGTAPNLRGLLNRSGVQTYATAAGATAKKSLDGIFHAMQLVKNNSFIAADGVVVNPTDYENMRLGVDGQSQYYGGGPFTGAYGNSGLQLQPGIWGMPTVVTPAIAAGTVLVGAFKTGAQLFRKGGVRLESTNSNEDDFKKNLVAMRVEERVALAVYYPTAFCKVTITA
jgi:HK97 family phage major capsid protein